MPVISPSHIVIKTFLKPGTFVFALAALMALLFQLPATAQTSQPNSTSEALKADTFYFCYQGRLSHQRIVIVDKSRQRLMVFKYLGELILEFEYPCATGSNIGRKMKEGDERTPVGIYFTTHRYKDNKVTIFGDRAIHLNYPNPFDLEAGHKGNGIYIHGTNQNLKPRSSNGCITLKNEDLAVVAALIKDQLTPIVVVERLKLADTGERITACDNLALLEESARHKTKPKNGSKVGLLSKNGHRSGDLASMDRKIAHLPINGRKKVKVENLGLLLLGLGNQWVLLADQSVTWPKNQPVKLTRRLYLHGDDKISKNLLFDEWVFPNLAAAKSLLSLAPKTIPRSAPKQTAKAKAKKKPDPEYRINKMLSAWIKAWQGKRLGSYMSHYAPGFKGDGMNRTEWRKRKAYLNRVYKKIRVQAKDLRIKVSGTRAEVVFTQHYRSDWHKDVGIKTLKLIKRKNRWQILRESWHSLPKTGGGSVRASISG